MKVRLSELKDIIQKYVDEQLELNEITAQTIQRNKRFAKQKADNHLQQFGSSLKMQDVAKIKLSDINPNVADAVVKSGQNDGNQNDDKINVTKASFKASALKPSQTSMMIQNTINIAIGMLAGEINNDLNCIVSKDGYIMDGHHRWSAAILVDPNTTVTGYQANLPGHQLVGVLNLVTKGVFHKKGNPGTGSIQSYTPEAIRTALTAVVQNGIQGKFGKSPEQVKSILEKKYKTVENALNVMSKNITAMTKQTPNWAPDRSDMPVINGEDIPKVAGDLNAGNYDVLPPYSSAVKSSMGMNERLLRDLIRKLL